MTRFIGIDLGTSFLKGAVLDLERASVSHIRRVPTPGPVAGLPSTRHELDPDAILAAVRTLIEDLLPDAPDASGLVMCSQMHGLVFTDPTGNAVSNVITWQNQRALETVGGSDRSVFDQLAALLNDVETEEIGRELRIGVPITVLYWLQLHKRIPVGMFATSLPDFVLANLCHVAPTTEATNAAAHGLLDLDRMDWHRNLIDRLGLGSLRWPRIRPFGEVGGEVEIAGKRLTCFTPVGDQQCALVGVGLRPGELSLNISTGSQASLISAERPRGAFQVRPYFDGQWLRTIVQIPAGRSLGALVDWLTEIGRAHGQTGDPWSYVAGAVEQVSDTDLQVDLGFFGNAAGGSIGNIRAGNLTVGHLFAAAFRTMSADYARYADVLSPERSWRRVVFSGGLAQRFPRLRREILTRLGEPAYRLCTTQEDTLRGLLTLAMVCAGQSPSAADAIRTLEHTP